MTPEEKLKIEEQIVEMLKTVYDPEIPVDIYNLGLIYNIDLADDGLLDIDMTLTAPNCPAADFIVEDVRIKTSSIPGIKDVRINLVFEPEWDRDMMSEEAKLDLGFIYPSSPPPPAHEPSASTPFRPRPPFGRTLRDVRKFATRRRGMSRLLAPPSLHPPQRVSRQPAGTALLERTER